MQVDPSIGAAAVDVKVIELIGNEKAGFELARTAKHVKLEGNFVEAKVGQRAVEDKGLKRL